jgi:hypothetical protein
MGEKTTALVPSFFIPRDAGLFLIETRAVGIEIRLPARDGRFGSGVLHQARKGSAPAAGFDRSISGA